MTDTNQKQPGNTLWSIADCAGLWMRTNSATTCNIVVIADEAHFSQEDLQQRWKWIWRALK